MSHTTKYKKIIKDVDLFMETAEKEFGYKVKRGEQTVKLFGSNITQAVGSVLIDGWKYPLAITAKGEILYDHFGSKANTMEKLGKLLQRYSTDHIIKNIPMDKVQHFFGTAVKDTGEYKLVLEY